MANFISKNSGEGGAYSADIVIVGGGISAALFVYSFVINLSNQKPSKPISIIVLEQNPENLWRGVPYGLLADKEAFLVETLERTGLPLFREWIINNVHLIKEYISQNNQVLQSWYRRHKRDIRNGNVDGIYFPRRIFGIFIQELMNDVLRRAVHQALLKVHVIGEEAESFSVFEGKRYQILTRPGSFITTERVILATGSIPRHSRCNLRKNSIYMDGYITDNKYCAYFDLENRFNDIFLRSKKKSYRLIIVGSSSSAAENIFYIAKNKRYLERISSITVISTSGQLSREIKAGDYDQRLVPDYVLQRSMSDMYVESIADLYNSGLLKIRKGKVREIYSDSKGYFISLDNSSSLGQLTQNTLVSDIVINCTGCGDIENTNSGFIKSLSEILPVTPEKRGFDVDENNQVCARDGVFVIGPLLNRYLIDRQVESIRAVFKEAITVARYLADVFSHT